MFTDDSASLQPNEALCRMLSIPRAMHADDVQRVLDLALAVDPVPGEIIPGSGPESKRNSEVRWLAHGPDTAWLYDRLGLLVSRLNNEHWRFDLGGLEPIQVARYPVGGTYDWHVDLGPGRASLRKLSVTVQLSESSDYDGGQLEFPDGPERIGPERGDAVVFPSFMHHRVAPVTRGERWSAVAWVVGTPFR